MMRETRARDGKLEQARADGAVQSEAAAFLDEMVKALPWLVPYSFQVSGLSAAQAAFGSALAHAAACSARAAVLASAATDGAVSCAGSGLSAFSLAGKGR